MKLYCPNCGKEVEFKAVFSGPHIKALCHVCDRYIKFLNKKEKAMIEHEEDRKE